MKQLSLLIKPASSLCNLRCKYCFYEDVSNHREQSSMGIMDSHTTLSLIKKSLSLDVSQVNYCFQGGEPTVAGIDYFHNFIDLVNTYNTNDKKITYAIQTNATLLNEDWYKLFKQYHFLVGVSLDGFLENHNKVRLNNENQGTFKIVMQAIKKLENHKIEYNILTVLTHNLSKKPKQLYTFYKQHNLKYIQLIPCLPTLEGNPIMDRFSLQPKDFSSFYKEFFDLWYLDFLKGNHMSVTLFDNVIPMYRGIPPQQCGMLGKCQMQFVIEGNGNVYPCDFFVLDQYKCGNINENSFDEITKHKSSITFLNEKRTLCKECNNCPFYNMCFGNCKRLNICYYDEHYCGYKDFLNYSKKRMMEISQLI